MRGASCRSRPGCSRALLLLTLGALGLGCASSEGVGRGPLPPPLPPLPLEEEEERAAAPAEAPDQELAAPPSGPLELSVEQAALSALRRNRDLAVRQLAPAVSGAFARSARGRYDPELFARLELGQERAVETARSTGQRFDVQGDSRSGVVGLRQYLPTGTTLEATVEQDAVDSDRTPEQQSARLGLTVTQALLQGFGPAVNLAAIEQADLEVQASRYELRGYAEALLAQTEDAYWGYVLAQQEIAIYDESLAVARRQRDEIEQEIEVGTLPRAEAAAARAEVALREQALIEARSELERRRLLLLRLVGADLERELVATSDPAVEPLPVTDLGERLELAQRSRAEIGEALLRLEQRRLETVVTRNGLLPRLDLFFALGKTGFSDELGGSFAQLRGETYDLLGGVDFSYFIGNRAAEGAHTAAQLSHRQAERAVDNLRQLVRLEVRLAANELERARQNIAATAATRALQEETVRVERERFEVGASTALLVAQAQRDLLASRIAEVEALVAYRTALVQLYLAEGTLLERRGLRIGR